MSASPPDLPFGDPSTITTQNRAAVGKGVMVGCGGCAVVLLGIAGVFSAIFFGVFAAIGKSDAVAEVMKRAGESKVVREQLGTPLQRGWLTTGNLETGNRSSSAEVQVPIEGPKGSGRIQANGYKRGDEPWVFNVLEVIIDKTGERIDLAHSAEAKP
jgi:hypothetical protein